MYTAVGLVGAVAILFGFYRITIGKWTGKSFWYEMDNLIGAVLVAIYQVHYKAYISVAVNAIWGIVALSGLSSFRERRRKKR